MGVKIAEGAFGKVYTAKWKGTPVILKSSKLTSPDPNSLRKGERALCLRCRVLCIQWITRGLVRHFWCI